MTISRFWAIADSEITITPPGRGRGGDRGRPTEPPGRGRGRGPGKGRGTPGGNGGGGGVSADIKIATQRFLTGGGSGNVDLTISGLGWTPKAAIFIGHADAKSDGIAADYLSVAYGATDGTNQWAVATRARHADGTSSETSRRAITDGCLLVLDGNSGGIKKEASFVSFISNGVRINFSEFAGGNFLTVIFFGGDDLSADAGTQFLATDTNTVTVTTGFQTSALFTCSVSGSMNDTPNSTAFFQPGVASYDGVTVRQAGLLYRSEDNFSPTEVIGEVRNDGVYVLNGDRRATVQNVTSTTFDLLSSGGDLSAQEIGYLALNLANGAEAWAGVVDTPTTTGNHDFTDPGFQPLYAYMLLSMISAVNTETTDGKAGAFGVSSIEASRQFSDAWADADGVTTTNTQSLSDDQAVNLENHTGGDEFEGTFDSFLSTGLRLNFSIADGTARKWPALFIGTGA